MERNRWEWIVPNTLWAHARPLLPSRKIRWCAGEPQNLPDEDVFAAIAYVLLSGCAWRSLPRCFPVSPSTANKRFRAWTEADVWERLLQEVFRNSNDQRCRALCHAMADAARVRSGGTAVTAARTPWRATNETATCGSCPHAGGCLSSVASDQETAFVTARNQALASS